MTDDIILDTIAAHREKHVVTSNLPDFYIVGAPKCGTTALYSYLSRHPSVFMPTEKEPHFFCTDIDGIESGYDLQSYLSLFADAPRGALIGEASVWYLFSRQAIPTILSLRPDAKIIVMMRNPVDMAKSLHAQFLNNLNENIDDFESAWRAQNERAKGKKIPWNCAPQILQYGEVCNFAEQIRRLMNIVPEKQRRFLVYEEFFSDPQRHYAELLRFLGLPSDGRTEFSVVNAAATARRKWLQRLLRQPPFPISHLRKPLRWASHKLSLHLGKLAISLIALHPQERVDIRREFERELYEYFGPSIDELEDLLGRRFDSWRSVEQRKLVKRV